MTTFIYVDRRKSARGKSTNNRQKLLDRIRDSIRNSKPKDLDIGAVSQSASGGGQVNPIKVARSRLSEPSFVYDRASGVSDVVLVGNDKWERGDDFPIDDGEGSGSGNGQPGQGEDSEDDFIVNISRQEFFDVFFEDCELPNLEETHEKDLPQAVTKPAGYQTTGNPAQLAVMRSYKNSRGRQLALTKGDREKLEELEVELIEVLRRLVANALTAEVRTELVARQAVLEEEIEGLRHKISAVGAFEKLDLRYRKRDKVLQKAADAVFIMIMDISGSMDEEKKTIARKFFSLQYAFIKRKYPQTDLVFIAHTDEAWEMTEEEFFTTRKSGGTTVSSAYVLAHQIIRERYDPKLTNLYLSQVSDGDNWDGDNAQLITELEDKGLLSKLRHMVYAQVGSPNTYGLNFFSGGSMWTTLNSVANTNNKLACVKIHTVEDIFGTFKKVYTK